MNHQEATENLEAYLLGALEPDEAELMAAHVDTCPLCQQAERQLTPALDALGTLVPQVNPSPDLRGRFLARLDEPYDHQQAEPQTDMAPVSRFSRWSRFGLAAAAAIALLFIGLLATMQQNLSETRDNLATVEVQMQDEQEVLAGLGEVIPITADNAPDARGMLYLSSENHRALLVVDKLPPANSDRVYQIWLVRDDQRTSVGVFTVNDAGNARVMIEADTPLDAYQMLGITEEPAPIGSDGPTGPRVAGCPLSAKE